MFRDFIEENPITSLLIVCMLGFGVVSVAMLHFGLMLVAMCFGIVALASFFLETL